MTEIKALKEVSPEVSAKDFTLQEMARVKEVANSIDINDVQAVLQYGVGAQRDIADFSDTVLQQVRSKDSGYVGDALNELMVKVQILDVDSVSGKQHKGLFNNITRRIKKFIGRYDKLSVQIDHIVTELEKARDTLFRDIELLNQLYDKNSGYIKELDVYIVAGDMRIKELRETVLPTLRAEAEETKDAVKAQGVRDAEAMVERFEKKVHDLKLSRMVAIQSIPQMRLVQHNDQVLVERIQSSILNTIPLWKSQVVIAITIFRQRSALAVQKEVTDTTNDLLKKNADMLKTGTIETAKEAEKGIVEIETLRQVNADLIETITESIRIQEEGRVTRANAEKELKALESELKQKLMETKRTE